VLVCSEDYPEAVQLVDGVSMFGGFDCATDVWKAQPAPARVRATTSPAVSANNIAATTRFEGFEVFAPDHDKDEPSESAASSVGLEIHDSKNLTFANTVIYAGTGAPGKAGAEGEANTETSTHTTGEPASPGGRGNGCPFVVTGCFSNALFFLGGSGGTSACGKGAGGGPGGSGGYGRFAKPGDPLTIAGFQERGQPLVATPATAQGGPEFCTDYRSGVLKPQYGAGDRGANGPDGDNGANGSWALSIAGFSAGHGTAGKDGLSAQGGGGGGGEKFPSAGFCSNSSSADGFAYHWSSTGGGGGSGGCAGSAGTAGFGGGASIAALIVRSEIVFLKTKLASSQGGAAGKGTLGSDGLAGGTGGAGTESGGRGGDGGRGGAGGLSGHGAPGPSIALAYTGTRPSLTETELAAGPGGAGHPALTKQASNGTLTLPAVAGESKPEHMF
jgi:hypothetical protein